MAILNVKGDMCLFAAEAQELKEELENITLRYSNELQLTIELVPNGFVAVDGMCPDENMRFEYESLCYDVSLALLPYLFSSGARTLN